MGETTPSDTPALKTNSADEPTATESTVAKNTADTSTDSNHATPSAEEVAGVVAELEQYRERLVEDFTATAKKAKLPKSMAMSQLKNHPEILKIDAALAKIRGEQTSQDAISSAD